MYVDPQRPARLFAEQFEPDAGGYLYRRSRKGVAIRVTSAERDRFVNAFVESQLRAVCISFASTGLLLMGLVFLANWYPEMSFNGIPSIVAICAAALVLSIPYVLYLKWIWAAPARELQGRTPAAAARSSAEMRQVRLAALTSRQLGLAALGALVLGVPMVRREQLYPGWNHFAFWTATALLLLIAVQAFRKWRFDRQNDDP